MGLFGSVPHSPADTAHGAHREGLDDLSSPAFALEVFALPSFD